MVGEVEAKLGGLKVMGSCPSQREMYHKEFNIVDLDRSSQNYRYPS